MSSDASVSIFIDTIDRGNIYSIAEMLVDLGVPFTITIENVDSSEEKSEE